MNKKIMVKIKQIAAKKEKLKVLENEIENLESEVQSEKDKEFNTLSKAFFAETDPAKKAEIEEKIMALIGGN